ncbi:RodZ domain-containing protein [Marinobacterium arenosum]|uniref:RodZ domain-containing protein n=1 Tax=Marinobacterium arenosum TaxID=2862496 RepID=UPI001C963B06|nr:RodZ domain-containing protein [Marinobacterium arenosum]MBY4678881.1 DUF4115 domain-containing protein [Marinobacterium arenosum]
MTTEQTVEQAESQRFPGERLQTARMARGLTIDDIANALHLPASYIEALENGDIDCLPSVVFARGYIRSYAKFLDVDADEFLGYLDEQYGMAQRSSVKSVTKVRQQMKLSHPLLRLSTWLLLIIVIGASIWWWRTQHELPEISGHSGEQQNAISVETSSGDTLVIPALNDAEPAVDEGAPAEAVSEAAAEEEAPSDLTEQQIAQLQAELDAVEGTASDEAAAAAELSRLQISFSGECWVTIKDASGKTLFNNVRNAGSKVDISGEAPFSVLLGASAGVSGMRFNGEAVDVVALSRDGMARFTLPLD